MPPRAAWLGLVCAHRSAFAGATLIMSDERGGRMLTCVYAAQSPYMAAFSPMHHQEVIVSSDTVNGENWQAFMGGSL